MIRNAGNFKCHQIIQEICKEKLQPDAQNCRLLINNLSYFFETSNTTQAVLFFEIGLSVVNKILDIDSDFASMQFDLADRMKETGNLTDSFILLTNSKNIFSELKDKDSIGVCLERMGTIYMIQGNLEDAMKCYQQYSSIEKELSKKYPDNVEYKNGLAISYQYLGTMYRTQGNLEDALKCYKQYNSIKKELSRKNPDNVEFKNGLAISYQYLGTIYQAQGNMEDALKFYLQYNTIEKDL